MTSPPSQQTSHPTRCTCARPWVHVIAGVWTCMICNAIEPGRTHTFPRAAFRPIIDHPGCDGVEPYGDGEPCRVCFPSETDASTGLEPRP